MRGLSLLGVGSRASWCWVSCSLASWAFAFFGGPAHSGLGGLHEARFLGVKVLGFEGRDGNGDGGGTGVRVAGVLAFVLGIFVG